MKLLKPEETAKLRKEQNRELMERNDKVVASLKKTLKLQNDANLDQEKAKKVREYEVWCEDLNKKKSKQLEELKKYTEAADLAREQLYVVLTRKDKLEDTLIDLQEEISRLELQLNWKRELLTKQ